MTGNMRIWRAPLAAMASVAMLATMGVAAATANAGTVVDNPDTTYSVRFGGKKLTDDGSGQEDVKPLSNYSAWNVGAGCCR